MFFISISFFILFIFTIFLKYKRRLQLGLKIPGTPFLNFIANIQLNKLKPERIFLLIAEYRQKHKCTFKIWLGFKLWVFLHSCEETKEVLNLPLVGRPLDFLYLEPLIGDGLLLSRGRKWSTRRKSMNPAFYPKILENFIHTFCRQANILVERLPVNEITEVSNYVFNFVLDTICETSMGAELNSQSDPKNIYAKAFHDASHLLFNRIVNPFLGIDFIYKNLPAGRKLNKAISTIHELTDDVIERKKRKMISSNNGSTINGDFSEFNEKKKYALLDVLFSIEVDGTPLSVADIREEVTTSLFAGIDTTKSSLVFMLYNFGKYKSMQQKAYEEIFFILGENNFEKSPLTLTDLNEMHYLELFMKESLRIHTTVPLTGRHISEETKIKDTLYPKDTTLWVNLYGLCHDDDLFPEPNKFIPERFDPNTEHFTSIPYSFLPYGGGPRICIGKRYSFLIMKVVLMKILLSYEIELAYPDEELKLIAEMVLKSENGINLIFKKRI